MAQSRNKRNQRAKRRSPAPVTPPVTERRRGLRRIVVAFLILVGLAGILAVSAPRDDGSGAPTDPRAPATPPVSVDPAR